MKRFLLTSCATALVLSVAGGNSAMAQTTYTVPSGQTQTVTTPVTDQGSTPNAVTVTGGGVVELDGLNSYTGGTTVNNNATLRVGQDANLGAAAGGVTLGDSSAIGILQVGGGGTTTPGNSFSTSRTITLNAGSGQINNFLTSGSAGNGIATFNGQITGAGTLSIGQGTVQLTNNKNNYAGETTVQGGAQLIVSNDAQLGATTLTVNGVTGANEINLGNSTAGSGGSLTIAPGTNGFTSARTILVGGGGGIINGSTGGGVATFTGQIVGGGELGINNGTVALTNTSNSYSGGTIIQNGATLQISDDTQLGYAYGQVSLGNGTTSGTLQYTNAAAVSSSRPFALNGPVDTILTNSAAPVTLAGQLAGSGGLNVGGTGTLILAGSNIFTGDVRVANGATLQIDADNVLGGYTSQTNSVTGQVTNTPNTTSTGALNLNTLHLDGGTLQLSAGFTLEHNITTSSQNSTIDTSSNSVVITSNISNDTNATGGIVKQGSGTLTLDGTNSYTGGTVINNGTLLLGDSTHKTASLAGDVTVNTGTIIGGSGTVSGTVINNGGAVAPANTLTVGNYIQGTGSLLAPEITPNTTSGTTASELKVTGLATIGGGTLSVGYGTGFLKAGTYTIFDAGAIAGSGFTTSNAGVVPSAGLIATLVQNGVNGCAATYCVVLTQKSDLPDHPTVLGSLTNVAMDQAQQTTGALLDRLATARTNALADELAVALTDTHRVRGTSPYGFWVQPLGQFGKEDGAGALPGYSTHGEGFLMGADTEWAPGISIGVALGYTYDSLSEQGGANGASKSPLLAVYGGWWNGPIAIDAVVSLGMGVINGSRPIDLPLAGTTTPVMQVANSSRAANTKVAALQGSGAWSFDGWVIGPQAGVKFVNLRQTGFTETGTDIYNFTVASQNLNSLRPFASVNLTKRFFIGDHWALVPDFKVGFEHEVNNDTRKISAQTEGDAQLWVFNGLLPGANILHLIGGIKWELDRTEAFYVDYDRQQSNSGETQYITGGFRYRL